MAPTTTARPGRYDGIRLSFQEAMSGYFKPGAASPAAGFSAGKEEDLGLRFDVTIHISDLGRFFRDLQHKAEITGTVSSKAFGGTRPIRDGRFELFSADPSTGMRRMVYFFQFDTDGKTYCLDGHKEISDDHARLDLVEDMTRLFTRIHCGEDRTAPVFGAGELYFHLRDSPSLLASIRVEGARSWFLEVGARVAFASFAWGALRDEYIKAVRLFYDTGYENLVLCGRMLGGAEETPFFLVSGVHDKGFPWGDGELFWDVLLAAGEAGARQLYCISDRVLEGLELDVTQGIYRYSGPLFRIREGNAASFSQMRAGAGNLEPVDAGITIDFDAVPYDTVPFPFPLVKPLVRKLSSDLGRRLREALPGERPLGINITPHMVRVKSGRLRVGQREWVLAPAATAGECERSTFRNLKEPTLLYGYLCAIEPDTGRTRVQIAARTLRDDPTNWVKDRLDAWIGSAVARSTASEMLIERDTFTVRPLGNGRKEAAPPLRKAGVPVLEVNNDHFPTAVFQRRIVEVEHVPSGTRMLALEEDMSSVRLEPVNSGRSVTVASMSAADKFTALDRVLDATGFDALLEEKLAASGKSRASFLIAIKPNFLFAYDKRDRTTYTDPELVHHLVKRLRASGFQSIRVVEAQSTYGQFFESRGVREMAAYLGYDGSAGYEVVDMTLDVDEERDLGPVLGVHPVSRVWRLADFRISFAKNKTHSYSYYSLTLKNIYGALPLANKFKEYHCERDIYSTTIEYLRAFPVHFGLIDGWLSADGPFGVFADTAPNETRTIIGGADLVAVDWIGATRMGLDPMVSRFMKLAVDAFGKPAIRLAGDANPYRPWLNVPSAIALLTHRGMDANYRFGNLLYMISAQMDQTHFQHKNNAWHIRVLRKMTDPVRRTFFIRTGENPSALNRFFSWLFYRMGY
jgi:cholesterol oxidase